MKGGVDAPDRRLRVHLLKFFATLSHDGSSAIFLLRYTLVTSSCSDGFLWLKPESAYPRLSSSRAIALDRCQSTFPLISVRNQVTVNNDCHVHEVQTRRSRTDGGPYSMGTALWQRGTPVRSEHATLG